MADSTQCVAPCPGCAHLVRLTPAGVVQCPNCRGKLRAGWYLRALPGDPIESAAVAQRDGLLEIVSLAQRSLNSVLGQEARAGVLQAESLLRSALKRYGRGTDAQAENAGVQER